MARVDAGALTGSVRVLKTWWRASPWVRHPVHALARFWNDNGPGMAATIAFFGFLSLVPLVLLLLAFLGGALGGLISDQEARQLFRSAVPGLTQTQFRHAYWDPVRHSRVATTVLGSITLLLGTLGLHDSVDWAVNRLWESTKRRPFWLMKLRGLAVIVWVIAFALFSIWLTWLLTTFSGALSVSLLAWAATLLPALLVDVAIFTALYRLTPTCDVEMKPAVVAGTVAAVLWEISKLAFAWWVIDEGSYNRVYGPLAASVIVMLWVWISSMIFLYGASLSVVIQRAAEATAGLRTAPPIE
jgi:membrane protein